MVGREEARDLIPSRAKRLTIGFVLRAYRASTIDGQFGGFRALLTVDVPECAIALTPLVALIEAGKVIVRLTS